MSDAEMNAEMKKWLDDNWYWGCCMRAYKAAHNQSDDDPLPRESELLKFLAESAVMRLGKQ